MAHRRCAGDEQHIRAAAIEDRSRALLSPGPVAESLYRDAIDRLEPTALRFDLARAHLVYGEWLRRERRNVDAREQLRVAHGFFTEFGMEGFAERARIELRATGEHARKRAAETSNDLTPQEAEISRLVAQGKTTSRSQRSSSSARAPSNTTCARSSGSSI